MLPQTDEAPFGERGRKALQLRVEYDQQNTCVICSAVFIKAPVRSDN